MLVSTSFNVLPSPSPCVSRSFARPSFKGKPPRRYRVRFGYVKRSPVSFMGKGWTERGMLVCGSNLSLNHPTRQCFILRLKLRLSFFFSEFFRLQNICENVSFSFGDRHHRIKFSKRKVRKAWRKKNGGRGIEIETL